MNTNFKDDDGHLYALSPAAARGIWAKVAGEAHPHAACVAMMDGKVSDPHAFCAEVEKLAAGTTPAERVSKKHAQGVRLDGVEIFAAGTHNGDTYTVADLDAMVAAFKALDYKPPLKAGHVKDKPGMPALGWVENLRRVGEKLVADFADIPAAAYKVIKDKLYNTVSAEIYWNLERAGKKYARALKAVALLGADIPAVAGLKPLHEMFEASDDVRIVAFNQEEKQMETDARIKDLENQLAALKAEAESTTAKAAAAIAQADKAYAAQLDAAAKRIETLEKTARDAEIAAKVAAVSIPAMRKYAQAFYELAWGGVKVYADGKEQSAMALADEMVATLNSQAETLFKEFSHASKKRDAPLDDPGAELDKRVREYREKHKDATYLAAMNAVLEADAALKHHYSTAITEE